jgi:hypothetical protein
MTGLSNDEDRWVPRLTGDGELETPGEVPAGAELIGWDKKHSFEEVGFASESACSVVKQGSP